MKKLLFTLAEIRKEGKEMNYLRPDAKSQFTLEYSDDNKPLRICDIVLSTQHDDFIKPEDSSEWSQLEADEKMLSQIRNDIKNIVIPRLLSKLSESDQNLFKSEYN